MKQIKIIIFIAVCSLSNISLANNINGIWEGIFDINGHGEYDFTGLISSNLATAYTEKAKVVYNGKVKTKKNKFKWNLLMYLQDGSSFGTAEIEGKIINNKVMSGKWVTEPAKDYGNIYLIKKSKEVVNTGEIINKKWTSYDGSSTHLLSIENYKLSGLDANGCNYYGDIKKLNKKIYGVKLEISSCGISDGFYEGMGHIKKNQEKNILILNLTNKNFSVFIKLL